MAPGGAEEASIVAVKAWVTVANGIYLTMVSERDEMDVAASERWSALREGARPCLDVLWRLLTVVGRRSVIVLKTVVVTSSTLVEVVKSTPRSLATDALARASEAASPIAVKLASVGICF